MLTTSDYISLKKSCKGWTAKKMRSYGMPWPPESGWRKKLLKEYESAMKIQATKKPPSMEKKEEPEWKINARAKAMSKKMDILFHDRLERDEPRERTPEERQEVIPISRYLFKHQ